LLVVHHGSGCVYSTPPLPPDLKPRVERCHLDLYLIRGGLRRILLASYRRALFTIFFRGDRDLFPFPINIEDRKRPEGNQID
jgi:hypothetical protein